MDYFGYILVFALFGTIVLVFISRFKKRNFPKESTSVYNHFEKGETTESLMLPKKLATTTKIDRTKLVKITDGNVISKISDAMPAIAQIATRTVKNKVMKNMELYSAVIPRGQTLAKSRNMNGAVRGFFLGKKGIKGQANFKKVNLRKAATASNVVGNMMNLGSFIVGQHYMKEISSKLDSITKQISSVGEFQDREFKSRIAVVVSDVQEISQFNSEIVEKKELRDRKLILLDGLKSEAKKLLEQVNITMNDILGKNTTLKYEEYAVKVDEFNTLISYQNIMNVVLEETCKLTYLLGLGDISIEQSYYAYNGYFEQSVNIRKTLNTWHDNHISQLKIDIGKKRIPRKGIQRAFVAVPGIFDEKFRYKELGQGLAKEINTQSQSAIKKEVKAVYENDVQLIIEGGEYYFLNETLK